LYYCKQNEAKEKTTLQNKENAESKSQLDLLLKRLGVTDKELDDLRKVLSESKVHVGHFI